MEITIGLWAVPLLVSIGLCVWVNYKFPSRGGYDFTPLFSVPLLAFLISFTWMIYFAAMYFWGPK